jgi:hypothetical protein
MRSRQRISAHADAAFGVIAAISEFGVVDAPSRTGVLRDRSSPVAKGRAIALGCDGRTGHETRAFHHTAKPAVSL